MTMRWRLNEKARGLARIGAGPRGSQLYLDGKPIASVNELRARIASRTFPGIASAMAEQWGIA